MLTVSKETDWFLRIDLRQRSVWKIHIKRFIYSEPPWYPKIKSQTVNKKKKRYKGLYNPSKLTNPLSVS